MFRLPGGSNQGVFFAGVSSGNNWGVEILENYTKFTGNGNIVDVGQNNNFYTIVPADQEMGTGFAEALASGTHTGTLNFNQVETQVAVRGIAKNNTPISWLRSFGYTNHFDQAALSDADGDLFLNWQEYHADTNPTNAMSYLALGIDCTNLSFAASSNCSYTVEWCDNLASNVWNTLASNISGPGGEVSVVDTNEVVECFYRLKAWRE